MFFWKGDMANGTAEVPLHQWVQMDNKREELEATVLLKGHELVVISESWWEESHDELWWLQPVQKGGGAEGLSSTKEMNGLWRALSEVTKRSKLHGWESEAEVTKGTLCMVSVRGCLSQGSLLTTPPSGSSHRRHWTHQISSCWGTSTPTSAGKEAQWAVGTPGDSWNAQRKRFLSQVMDSPDTGDLSLELRVTRASELMGDIKDGAARAAVNSTGGVCSPEEYGTGEEYSQEFPEF